MGLATARLLVANGGTVVLVARDEDKLVRRQKELEFFGKGKVETIVAVRNMVKCGGGSIVNIGAMWAHLAIKATPLSAYSMQLVCLR